MHLLSPYAIEMLLSKAMFERVRADDWEPVLAVAKDQPGLLPFLAVLTIDYGYLEGLKSLFDKGLDPDAVVQKDWLRGVGYGKAWTVPLVRLVAEMCSPGYRGPDTMAGYFRLFQERGANISVDVLGVVVQADDVGATQQLLDHSPQLLRQALQSPAICIAKLIYSPAMMQLMLDKGLPTRGDEGVAEWLWSRLNGFTLQTPQVVEVLARHGADLDQPKPDCPAAGDGTVLENMLTRPDRVEEGEVPYLLALVEHGARVDRVDLDRLYAPLPRVAEAITKKRAQSQAQALACSTPPSQRPSRQSRL